MMNQSNQPQVLYVDDEPQALKYFSRLFEDRFSIATASSADEAIAYLQANSDRVGVLLTDQRMPTTTGVQLLEYVRDRYPNIVRLLVTAYSDLDAAIKAVNEGGAFRYLTKPTAEAEMYGALIRAIDYHQALTDRDRLMQEKISVLHRLIVMDRIRGLSTAATALEGRLHNAWQALVSYMQQSPLQQRMNIQMEEILGLNMVAIAKREAEIMVRTVESLIADTTDVSTGFVSDVDLRSELAAFVTQQQVDFASDDIELSLSSESIDTAPVASTDRGMVQRLFVILARRLADLQEHPAKIEFALQDIGDGFEVVARGNFSDFTPSHVASLFAAAIPLHRWPIGLDMDLLGAFMIVHHLGGTITVEASPPTGPGFRMVLPKTAPERSAGQRRDPQWFDHIYDSLEIWEASLLPD
jgi:two-component system, probable response regulator PhcQ